MLYLLSLITLFSESTLELCLIPFAIFTLKSKLVYTKEKVRFLQTTNLEEEEYAYFN